jgi:hypothetical protein
MWVMTVRYLLRPTQGLYPRLAQGPTNQSKSAVCWPCLTKPPPGYPFLLRRIPGRHMPNQT